LKRQGFDRQGFAGSSGFWARKADYIKGVLRSEFGRVPGGQGHLAQNHAKSLFAGYFWLDED
jgi:hypothetical protein